MFHAFDTGPHTGVAEWESSRDSYYFNTLNFTEAAQPHKTLWLYLVRRVQVGDTIIYEKFEYQPDKEGRAGRNYDAAEYNGIIKLFEQNCAAQMNLTFVAQSPSQAVGDKVFWTNDKLRQVGLYRPGKRHENDALRHLLYYRTFKLQDKSLLLKLK